MRQVMAREALLGLLMLAFASLSAGSTVKLSFYGPAEYYEFDFVNDKLFSAETFVSGHVTYDTSVQPWNFTGGADEGQRLFYSGAITEFDFTSPFVSRIVFYSGNYIQVVNDYNQCIASSSGVCLNHQAWSDLLTFSLLWGYESYESAELIVSGRGQSMLSSAQLPIGLPNPDQISGSDFYWTNNGMTSMAGMTSNSISFIPEPSTLPFVTGGVIAVLLKTARFHRT